MSKSITVSATINAPLERVWNAWTKPEHITQWNFASPEWHCPSAENDLAENGVFSYRMAARDGSMGFDFSGTYRKVIEGSLIEFALDDNRKVKITFTPGENSTEVTETFEAEDMNPVEMQQQGWQAILNNFKAYVERS